MTPRLRKRETDRDIERQTETDRGRQRLTETNRGRGRQAKAACFKHVHTSERAPQAERALTDLEPNSKLFHSRVVVGVVRRHPAPDGLVGGHGLKPDAGGDEVVAAHLQHLLATHQHSEQYCRQEESVDG